jgi:hypothetical protein
VSFGNASTTASETDAVGDSSGFWNNPAGNPDIPSDNYTSPWRRANAHARALNSSPTGILQYSQPIQYNVRKTGYYCVGKMSPISLLLLLNRYSSVVVPVTVLPERRQASTDVPFHPNYDGTVLFRNTFDGKLPATDYPKVNVRASFSAERIH